MGFVSKLSLRYQRKRRGFVSLVSMFSVIGITLGVAALIIVMSVMTGFRQELLKTILGTTGHAVIQNYNLNTSIADKASEQLLTNEKILMADVFVTGQAMIVSRGIASGVLLRGTNGTKQNEVSQKLVVGTSNKLLNNQIFIGKDLAKKLKVNVGDSVNLISPDGTQTIVGFIPRIKKLTIAGIFNFGMYQYDSSFVYTNLKTAQSFFKMNDQVTGIELKVIDPMQINTFKDYVQMVLDDIDPTAPPAQFNTWETQNVEFFKALEIEKRTMFIILMLIIIVATFNIITGQMMLVNDKTKDIAILRSMGASSAQIQKVFFYSGMFLGIIGTSIGALLGCLVVLNLTELVQFLERLFNTTLFSGQVYYLDKLPAQLNTDDLITVIAVSIALSIISSWFPSRKASKLNPVETLRND